MALQTGIFSGLLAEQRDRMALEVRSSLENPQTPLSYPAEWLLDIWNGGRTDSGIRVSELTAFQVATFLTCVDLVASKVASLPVHVFERVNLQNGRTAHRVAYEHDYYELIHIEPNPEMSRVTFLKTLMAQVLAWGNGYAELQRDTGNAVVAIWPRNPYKTRPHRLGAPMRLDPVPWRPFPLNLPAGALVYRTTDGIDDSDRSDLEAESASSGRFIPADDMIHVPGLAFDGRIGQSVVWLARETLGLILAAQKFGAKYFANFARPGGLLELPMNLKPEDKESARRSWMEAQGGENSHRVAVMPPGFKFTPISNNPEQSQTVETQQFLRGVVCSIFHVPPHMAGEVERGKATVEQMGQELKEYTFSPWTTALKIEYKRKLFPNSGIGRKPKNAFFVDFDMHEMVRPDAASLEKFYASGKQWGYLNTNDMRAREGINPIDEGWAEEYWMPINMTLSTTPLDPNYQDGDGDGAKPGARQFQPYSRLFRDAFGRVLARENRDMRAFQQVFGPVLFSMRDAFFDAAAADIELESKPGAETDKFIAEYLAGMQKRAAEWNAESADETAKQELERATRALRMAAYREAGALKAKGEEKNVA